MVSESCQFITPVIVIVGWFFVDWRTNNRELRKEKRSLIDKIHIDIDFIEKKAIEYHQAEYANEQVSKEIKILLGRLIKVINREELIVKKDFWIFSAFKKAITLNNFDSSTFMCQSDNSELLDKIYATKDSLIDKVESEFSKRFR